MRARAGAGALVLLVGTAVGAGSVVLDRAESPFSLAGQSPFRETVELLAGLGLIAAGLASWRERRPRAFGSLLVATGFAWFLAEWNNPQAGSALVFTIGLVLGSSCAAFAVHAVIAFPAGRVERRVEHAIVAFGYAALIGLLGLAPALVFAPRQQGCSACPANLVVVEGSTGVVDQLNRIGLRVALAWALAAAVLLLFRLWRASAARRRLTGFVVAATVVYLGFVAADLVHSLGRGYLSNDGVDRTLWLGEAGGLVGLALAALTVLARTSVARRTVARLVVELGASPAPGALRAALAGLLEDPSLRIAYRLDDGSLADESGEPMDVTGEGTRIVRGGSEVARILHRPGVVDDQAVVDEVTSVARLAFENERLRAGVRRQLEHLRASRARIVAAGEAERRRLELDLHDGAQQRLVALTIRLALERASTEDVAVAEKLADAEREVRAALAELRGIAHGIFPVVLAEEGLPAALVALVEETELPVTFGPLVEGRVDPRVEAAAYFVVTAAAREGAVRVSSTRRDGLFVLELDWSADREPELQEIEDRVGALDGQVVLDGQTLRAEIPCAS